MKIEKQLKEIIDNHNRPFKHLRLKYDKQLIEAIESTLKDLFGSDVDVNQVTINKNNKLGKHKHPNQAPLSYGYVFGSFTDGELVTENEVISLKNTWFKFDGTKEHYVNDFNGDRYSIIAYKRN